MPPKRRKKATKMSTEKSGNDNFEVTGLKLMLLGRAALLFLFLPLITLLFSIACVFYFIPFCDRKTMDRVILVWSKLLCELAGVRVHCSGLQNLKGMKSVLILSNHQSHFDIPVLFSSVPLSFRMAAKKELFMIPLFGQVLTKAGFIPLDRKRVESSQQSLKVMKSSFKNGESFWMAPEGTRYKGEGVGDFKSGAFHLAVQTDQPIIPICIYGTHKVLPKDELLANKGQLWQDVYVQILPPVYAEGRSRAELKNAVRKQILAAYLDMQQESSSSLSLTTQA